LTGTNGSPRAADTQDARAARWLPALLAWGLLLFAARGVVDALSRFPVGDEPAFLEESNWIHEHGGLTGFPAVCLRGEYPFHNRNPLLPLLASPFIARTLDAAVAARLLKLALLLAGMGALFFLTRARLGRGGAAVFVLWLSLSHEWVFAAPNYTAEPLIFILFFAGWYLLAGLAPAGRGWGFGLLLGATWLCKASALLLPLAALAALPLWLWRNPEGRRAFARRETLRRLLAAGLGFTLMAWPVLIDRAVARGSPLFNDNQAALWLDNYDAQYARLARGEASPGARAWWALHGVADAARRLAAGGVQQATLLKRALNMEIPHSSGAVFLITLLLAVMGWRRLPDGWSRLYTLALSGITLLLLAWMTLTPAPRLTGILQPILVFLAVLGGRDLFLRLAPHFRTGWLAAALAFLPLLLLPGLLRADFHFSLRLAPPPPATRALLDRMRGIRDERAHLCMQSERLFPDYQVNWLLGPDPRFCTLEGVATLAQVNHHAELCRVDCLLLGPAQREAAQPAFASAFAAAGGDYPALLPGWRLADHAGSPAAGWAMYDRDTRASPASVPGIVEVRP
jgi:hypothetical protein